MDDLGYVTNDQAETSVLIELISSRYKRRPIPSITAGHRLGNTTRCSLIRLWHWRPSACWFITGPSSSLTSRVIAVRARSYVPSWTEGLGRIVST
nr:hypothetical protein [Paraburkholderia monticola]